MKRIILILLALMTVFSFSACGNKDDDITVGEGLKLAGKQAGNEAVEYSFTYPDAWEMCRNDGVIELQFDCDDSAMTARYATISVLSFDLEDSTELAKQYWEKHEAELKTVYTDYQLLDTEEFVEDDELLDDAQALKVKYSGKLNDITYLNEQIICCRLGSVYLITLVVPAEFESKVTDVLDVVKEDFKFA